MKIYLFFILFPITFIFGQIDPNANIFNGIQPKWSHAALDSSAIGYNGRTGFDWYLGSNTILDKNDVYTVYNNSFETNSGYYIEKLDLKTGNKKWDYHYDLRDSNLQEINSSIDLRNNKLLLLNFQNSQDTFIFSWDKGIFSLKTLDIITGKITSNLSCPKQLPNCPEYSINGGFNISNTVDNYCYYATKPLRNTLNHIKFLLDSLGRELKRDTINYELEYKYLNESSYKIHYWNNKIDTLISLRYNFNSLDNFNVDTFSLYIDIFDSNLKKIKSLDLKNQVSHVKEYSLISNENNRFVLFTTEYLNDSTFPLNRIDIISENGELIEEIVYHSILKNSYEKCIAVLKNPNGVGDIIVNANGNDSIPYNNKITFYKSDGKGNMVKLTEIGLLNKYQIGLSQFKITENGDIFIIGLFRDYDLPIKKRIISERYISTLWDGKLFQTESNKINAPEIKKTLIYPNPTENDCTISNIAAKFPIKVVVFNIQGICVESFLIQDKNDFKLKTSQWLPGYYIVEIFDKDNSLYSLQKILKK